MYDNIEVTNRFIKNENNFVIILFSSFFRDVETKALIVVLRNIVRCEYTLINGCKFLYRYCRRYPSQSGRSDHHDKYDIIYVSFFTVFEKTHYFKFTAMNNKLNQEKNLLLTGVVFILRCNPSDSVEKTPCAEILDVFQVKLMDQ